MDTENAPVTHDDPDPELVEMMRDRVVRRKPMDPAARRPGPGRPKGCTKSPNSGKRAGTPNLMSPEFRDWLAKKAKPFELLASICRGDEIDDGDGKRRRPSVAERMRAAETLISRIAPALKATEVTGTGNQLKVVIGPEDEGLLYGNGPAGQHVADVELARRLAFLMTQGVASQERLEKAGLSRLLDGGDKALLGGAPVEVPEEAVEVIPPVGTEEHEDGITFRIAERLPDNRTRWEARAPGGALLGTSFDRASLGARLRAAQGR